VKPKLLVLELWGLGDLAMATPFLQAATENFSVTLLAKPFAEELRGRLWPEVKVIPFNAPWTAFRGKYNLWRWPWIKMLPMQRQLAREKFDVGVSARWDPRDHFILWAIGARQRLGVSRLGSQCFLTNNLHRNPLAHHYNDWRELAINLGLNLPVREKLFIPAAKNSQTILVHTGAGQPVRVWPLQNFQEIVAHLRRENFFVQVACDSEQRAWWLRVGEKNVATPTTASAHSSATIPAPAIWPHFAASRPSQFLARNFLNGSRHCIRLQNFLKAAIAPTNRVRIIAVLKKISACKICRPWKSGRAFFNSRKNICPQF
jgi:hypothetical protein